MTRLQSDKAYKDWVARRKAEDLVNAEIAEHDQATRWHEFHRDDEEETYCINDFTRAPARRIAKTGDDSQIDVEAGTR